MDISTSNPNAPEFRTPVYRVIESTSEQAAAVDELLTRATHTLRVFDVDLTQTGWERAARADAIAQFLLRTRDARVRMIVHDTRHLESSCARLTALLRRFSAAITIYRTGPEARAATDPLVIVDDCHFLHRFHSEQPRAALVFDDPAQTKPLLSRFEEIWNTGEPGLAGDVLGL